MWLVPIGVGLYAGPEKGAVVGFWSGIATDLLLPTPLGLSALIGCLIGYGVGMISLIPGDRALWLAPVVALGASAVSVVAYAGFGDIFGQSEMLKIDLPALVLVVSLFNAALAVPVSALLKWASSRPEREPLYLGKY